MGMTKIFRGCILVQGGENLPGSYIESEAVQILAGSSIFSPLKPKLSLIKP